MQEILAKICPSGQPSNWSKTNPAIKFMKALYIDILEKPMEFHIS